MCAEVEDATGNGSGGAAQGGAAAAVADDFAADAAFLAGERERGGGGREQVGIGGGEQDDPMRTDEELDVAQGERSSVGGAAGVLAGAEEVEEGDDGHIGNGLEGGIVGLRGSDAEGVVDEANRDGFYPIRWGVGLGVRAELALEAEVECADGGFAEVPGPHAGERLADRAKGVLHCARANGPAAGGKAAGAVAFGEDLEDRDGVGEVGKVGLAVEGGGICHPERPMLIGRAGTARNDAGADRCVSKAEISAEVMGERAWQSCQEVICGKEVLKRASNCESERSQRREHASAMALAGPAM